MSLYEIPSSLFFLGCSHDGSQYFHHYLCQIFHVEGKGVLSNMHHHYSCSTYSPNRSISNKIPSTSKFKYVNNSSSSKRCKCFNNNNLTRYYVEVGNVVCRKFLCYVLTKSGSLENCILSMIFGQIA